MATLDLSDVGPARPMRPGEIPLIDFAPFRTGDPAARLAVAKAIGRACEQVGFFYLTGSGVAQAELDAVFAESRRFFAQPREARARTAATWAWYRGWVPPKSIGEDGRPGGVSEVYRLMLDLPPDDPDVVAGKPLHLPNRWPEHLPGFRERVGGYIDTMLGFSGQVLHAFALALDLPETWFDDKFTRPLIQLSLLWYPPLPADAAAETMSSFPHTDEGAFTMLAQDGVGGLEVRSRSGEWIAAPLIEGAYIVNIGDMLMKWTNGRFVSTPHRVRNRSGRERFSVPFFMNPDYDVTVACLPTCTGPGNPPRFAPVANGPHMQLFWEKGMAYLKDRAA
ncbi:MAG: isopenicillin N synthase family dioxygenase [Alphaproteobacteria bacterium]